MTLRSHMEGDILVVRVEGPRLDAAAAGAFKSEMVDFIHAGKHRLALDLSTVDFMDSTGLAALLSTMKTLGGTGEIVLSGLSEKVRKLFAITRLDRGVFRIFNTVDEMVNALRG
ncbi:anti-sigma factor antagonist [Desulfovibrio aminophilus]|uniref:STAS domain-containing protein n=1 Tax=Desulfovibrio aminophilus TaxID=81425 RepID=UPI003396E5EB